MSTKTYTKIPDEGINGYRKRKNTYSISSRLKNQRSFSYTIITKKSCFLLCCCSLHNEKWIIGD
jgi:hypothetical protein